MNACPGRTARRGNVPTTEAAPRHECRVGPHVASTQGLETGLHRHWTEANHKKNRNSKNHAWSMRCRAGIGPGQRLACGTFAWELRPFANWVAVPAAHLLRVVLAAHAEDHLEPRC